MSSQTPASSPIAPIQIAPVQIAAALSRRVIGQSTAVREIAVALSKHLAGVAAGNVLLIGSSGSGKTTLMRAVEGFLAADSRLARRSTVIRLHANVLAEEARRGRPGQVVLGQLLDEARRQLGAETTLETLLDRAASGLVFVDEIDKIRSEVGGRPNVAGIRAQEALLTLIENESIPFELPEWAGGGVTTVDSRRLLFVCAGAFEGLYDAVYDRVTVGEDRGALKPTTVVDQGEVREEIAFDLRDWLRYEDLFVYGMSPQFLSRFDGVVILETLGEDELVKIFLESPESAYRQARQYFASQDIHLALSPAAVRRIATAAAAQPRLGARALKEVFRRLIRDYEFDPAPAVTDGKLLLDVAEVEAALGTP